VGSLEKRMENLEGRIEPPEDEGRAKRRAILRAIIEDFGRLKGSRAVHYWSGPNGMTPIEPEDIPGQYLTKPYTTGDLIDLAIKRVWEREGLDEDLMAPWMQAYKGALEQRGYDLEKVEDDGT
jgi:hypothetical protein